MRVFYLPAERRTDSITEMVPSWTVSRWQKKVEVVSVLGELLPGPHMPISHIKYGLTQVSNLVTVLHAYGATKEDVIYFDDLDTPGIEALAGLLMEHFPDRPRMFAHAGHRGYLKDPTLAESLAGIICSTHQHRRHLIMCGFPTDKLYPLGLPFSTVSVQTLSAELTTTKPLQVIYASSLKSSNDPEFFLELYVRALKQRPDLRFVICSGAASLPTRDEVLIKQIEAHQESGSLWVVLNASKSQYYDLLRRSRVHLCTSLGVALPYSVVEASALDTVTLAPAAGAFLDAIKKPAQLYVPRCLDDATAKLISLVDNPQPDGRWLAHAQNETLDRILQLFRDPQFRPHSRPWWEDWNGYP